MGLFPANVVLFINEGSGTLTTDKFGNPVETRNSIGQYLLSLSSDGTTPILKSSTGQPTSVESYSGHCVGKLLPDGSISKSKLLPPQVMSGESFRCEITDPVSKQKQRGNFVVLSVFQSKYRAVTKALGFKVTGYFEFGR